MSVGPLVPHTCVHIFVHSQVSVVRSEPSLLIKDDVFLPLTSHLYFCMACYGGFLFKQLYLNFKGDNLKGDMCTQIIT